MNLNDHIIHLTKLDHMFSENATLVVVDKSSVTIIKCLFYFRRFNKLIKLPLFIFVQLKRVISKVQSLMAEFHHQLIQHLLQVIDNLILIIQRSYLSLRKGLS